MRTEVTEPLEPKALSMRLVGLGWLGMLLGLTIGGIPLVGAYMKGPHVDPFDYGISYVVWVGGLFLAALGLALARPQQRWSCAFALFSGFFAAIVLGIIVVTSTGRFPNVLWPLTLAFSVLIGTLPAFTGAYCGSKLKKE
jgi:hypothetical protein